MNKIILITGATSGFGKAIAEKFAASQWNLIITGRRKERLELISKELNTTYGVEVLPLVFDVQDKNAVFTTITGMPEKWKKIDVLVNNAGIGYFGAIEESEDEEVRRMFEINFFGLAKMIQEALPHMRKRKSGHILNIASIGGLRSFPGVGFYNATKYAVDGLSEALYKELSPLGIKVTIVAPSGFRTDWAGRSAKDTSIKIDDYAGTSGKNMGDIRGYSGNQPGDPVKAAKAMIEITETEKPPLRLLLGVAALKGARAKLEELKNDFDTWAATSEGADFKKE